MATMNSSHALFPVSFSPSLYQYLHRRLDARPQERRPLRERHRRPDGRPLGQGRKHRVDLLRRRRRRERRRLGRELARQRGRAQHRRERGDGRGGDADRGLEGAADGAPDGGRHEWCVGGGGERDEGARERERSIDFFSPPLSTSTTSSTSALLASSPRAYLSGSLSLSLKPRPLKKTESQRKHIRRPGDSKRRSSLFPAFFIVSRALPRFPLC